MKCSVCHDELSSPNAICTGRLPGAAGLVHFSPGPCKSTPEQRAEVTARRIEAAKRAAEHEGK